MSAKMSMMKYLIAVGAITAISAKAASPLGGLAVGVSPDGKTLATAGDNRTLYVLDADKLEVKQRFWIQSSIINMAFNQGGDKVVAEDTQGVVQLLSLDGGKVLAKIDKAEKMCVAPSANLLAGVAGFSGGIVLHALDDLTPKGKIEVNKGDRVAAIGFDSTGTKLAVWFEPANDSGEPKESKVPSGLKQLEADEFKLKNDGKTSWIRVFNTANGSLIWESKLWYSPSSSGVNVLFQGESVLIVNYSNINAIVGPKGDVKLFQAANSFNYGIGASGDTLLTGGLANGSYIKTADLAPVTFKVDKLPGWPEYFKSFSVDQNGVGYGGTSAYRVVRIGDNGKDVKAVPVY